MSSTVYDYAIIGAGAAGLHLLNNMVGDNWFSNKKILIIEKEDKATNDRTWSFWEKGVGKWDDLITHSWEEGHFITSRRDISLSLLPDITTRSSG